jgi:hypothetical protein
MKLTKTIFGAANGEIYPRVYQVGDDCPDELVPAALEAGAISEEDVLAAAAAEAKAKAEAEMLEQSKAKTKEKPKN